MNKYITQFSQSIIMTLMVLIINSTVYQGQVVYEPVKLDIYNFLDRLNLTGIIQLDSEVKPYSRKYIAEKLIIIHSKIVRLNEIEKADLKFYEKEYGTEINRINEKNSLEIPVDELSRENFRSNSTWFGADRYDRMRLYSYEDSIFSMKVSPIAGYGISAFSDKRGHNRRIGVRIFAAYGNNFGASLQMSDNGEFGDDVDYKKDFSPQTGYDFYSAKGGHEFSDVRAQVNYSWGWGALSLKKDYMYWGNAYFGNLILSDKAASFPHIYLEIKPEPWLRFYYVYGWIHSGVIDSSRTQIITPSLDGLGTFNRFFKKYFVSNMLTLSPYEWMDFSLGNSIIYAGDIRPEMFIPFNFYKYMDRDTGKGSEEDGNGALHFDLAVRYPNEFKFYSTLFVDCASIKGILKNDYRETWIGYTFGGRKVNLIPNLDLTIEYTRLNPWVYEHKLSITNYKHLGYPLGHWLGQNADQFRVQFDYQIIRGLLTSIYFERDRKGGLKDIALAYGNNPAPEFLYGPLRKDTYINFSIKYEFIHELFAKFVYQYSDITDEDLSRTPEFMLGKKHGYSLEFYYGIP